MFEQLKPMKQFMIYQFRSQSCKKAKTADNLSRCAFKPIRTRGASDKQSLSAGDITLMILSVMIGITALFRYSSAQDTILRILLWPHARIVSAVFHFTLHYQNGIGYVAAGEHFAIGPACMGLNFIVMLFCLLVCVFTCRFHGFGKVAFFILALISSVIIGILVSCFRIVGSIPLISFNRFTTVHTGLGIILYLAALLSCYFLMNTIKGGNHEEHL